MGVSGSHANQSETTAASTCACEPVALRTRRSCRRSCQLSVELLVLRAATDKSEASSPAACFRDVSAGWSSCAPTSAMTGRAHRDKHQRMRPRSPAHRRQNPFSSHARRPRRKLSGRCSGASCVYKGPRKGGGRHSAVPAETLLILAQYGEFAQTGAVLRSAARRVLRVADSADLYLRSWLRRTRTPTFASW